MKVIDKNVGRNIVPAVFGIFRIAEGVPETHDFDLSEIDAGKITEGQGINVVVARFLTSNQYQR